VKRPSLTHLGLGILALFLVVVAGAWVYLAAEAESLRQHIRAREQAAARSELESQLRAYVQRVTRQLGNLASLDETRQQLMDAEYYVIWRDERMPRSGLLPPGTRAFALYDARGLILRRDASMPERLPLVRSLTARVRAEDGGPLLLLALPIQVHPDRHDIHMGYLALKLDLVQALRQQYAWRFSDPTSLEFTPPAGEPLNLDDLGRYLRITPKTNEDYHAPLERLEAIHRNMSLFVLAALTLIFLLLRRYLIQPIRRLAREITHLYLAPQATPTPLRDEPVAELSTLQLAFEDYHRRLREMHQDLEQANRTHYRQARHDALTETLNRRAFDEDWRTLEQDKRVRECALILFDCDHFKAINDTYGHPVGDRVIKALAHCLGSAIRSGDKLYRLGGDEFATLLPATSLDTALAVAQRCLERVQAHDFRQYGIREPVSVSIGLAHGAAPLDLVNLHKQADLAMYHAKRPGHAKIVVYEEALGTLAALVDNGEVSAVYEAIRAPDLVEFRYQPIHRLPAMEPEYVEALCRIRHEAKIIGPGAIFTIVQNRRLDVEFDLAVIRAIRRDLEADRPELRQGVSINLSGPGVVSDEVLAALMALRRDFPERKIVVEITETALITQMETATAHLQELRQAGFLVALDDFGSGYSSLRYLASMPVDMVKFDMSLVRLLEQEDPRQRLLLQDIARMVASAGYEMVAEGIETETLLKGVIECGFSHGQGFYFDRLGRGGG
jgi:diguanylate cyclase (GGDEF)-like protein